MTDMAPAPQRGENVSWDGLVLPDTLVDQLANLRNKLRNWEVLTAQGVAIPERILLYGPPGTGKTAIAQALAKECGLPLVAATISECKGQFLGESFIRVKRLFKRARAQRPCILFVDGFDVSGAAQDAFHMDFVAEFKMALDGMKAEDGVFFLAAAIYLEGIDSAILFRFSERIQTSYPGEDLRRRILQSVIAQVPNDFDIDQVCGELAASVGEVSGRDLKELVNRASYYAVRREHFILKHEDLLRALKR